MQRVALAAAALLFSVGLASAEGTAVNANQLKWAEAPPVLPKGAQVAVISGNPMGERPVRNPP